MLILGKDLNAKENWIDLSLSFYCVKQNYSYFYFDTITSFVFPCPKDHICDLPYIIHQKKNYYNFICFDIFLKLFSVDFWGTKMLLCYINKYISLFKRYVGDLMDRMNMKRLPKSFFWHETTYQFSQKYRISTWDEMWCSIKQFRV